MKLTDAKNNRSYRIQTVPEHPMLSGLDIRPNQLIRFRWRFPFAGPVVFQMMQNLIAIGYRTAEQIQIEEYESHDCKKSKTSEYANRPDS